MTEHAFRDLLAEPPAMGSEALADLLESAARVACSAARNETVIVADTTADPLTIAFVELPVAALKIDRSFTMKLGVEPQMHRVFAAITDLAHALDLPVVAEGIENQAMLEVVAELGCDDAQGLLFARPLPAEDLRKVIRAEPRGVVPP